ncbi:MAG: HEAT repeat domain-containing protein [Planctomycetota bacterium]|nr:HEAT repeat domain-containing protein [Planctomycetota bacterium]
MKTNKRLKVLLIAGILVICVGAIIVYRMQQHSQFMIRLEMSPGDLTLSDVPRLIRVLEDTSEGNWEMQPRAARALGRMGPDAAAAVPALIEKLDYFGDSSIVRGALSEIGAVTVPAIVEELKRGSDETGLASILGTIGPDAAEAVPLLCEKVKSRNYSMRREASWALGQIHANPTEAVPSLISVLNDPETSVRQRAVLALSHFEASEQIVAALAKVKLDETEYVRTNARAVLFLISDEAADENVRRAAMEAVAEFPE